MKTTLGSLGLSFIALAVVSRIWIVGAAASQEFTQPPIHLEAKEVLPRSLLQGKNYKVENQVTNDGLINVYQLTTDYGPLTAESTAELKIRVTELNALVRKRGNVRAEERCSPGREGAVSCHT
jgi:hypothetical protein